jgi:KipI family sensor histidine kinase inhibitor
MSPESFERYFIGDDCVCWSFGNKIDAEINKKVLYLYKKLKNSPLNCELNLRDIVPSYKAMAVYFDPGTANTGKLIENIEAFIIANNELYIKDEMFTRKRIVLPVVYDGEDLGRVASLHNLSMDEVIQKHTAPEYQVALVGFKPHFPYLIGLDKDLATPRLDNPRKTVPAGSVGIGGAQTGVYPVECPGGWNLIGRTNPELLKEIEPGDIIIMKAVKEL